jgi:DNA-binding CsgD family transcriptional regulator
MNDLLPGRGADLAAIHRFVDAATRDGGALLITGEPGVGKTVLLDAAARYGSAAGARILRTAGAASGGHARYQALDQLLAPLSDEFGAGDALRVALGLAGGPAPGRLRVSHETLDLLRRTGERRPLLVLVDAGEDLDEDSARVLTFVARRLAGSRVAMIFAGRAPWASGVLGRGGLPEHPVGPIDGEAAATLVERQHPGIAPHVRDRLVAEAGGNPQALLEYAAALTDGHRSGADPLPVPLPIGERARALTGAVLAEFPPATREVLLLAALEETGDLTAVRAAAGGADVLAALAPVVRRGHVTVDERARRVTFAHPLLRAAIVVHAVDLQLRRAHRALAAAWAHEPDRQVRHLAAAGGGADADLAERLRENAAAAIRRGATAAALDALTLAAETTPDPAQRNRWRLEAAFLRADLTGDLRHADRLLDDAGTAGADSLPLAVTVASVALNGDIASGAAHRVLVEAVEAYEHNTDADDPTLIAALHALVANCWFSAVPESWEPYERAAARLRPRPPADLEIAAAGLGNPVALTGRLLGELDAAVDALRAEDNPVVITRTALPCVYTDRLAACREPLTRVIRTGGTRVALHATTSYGLDLWQSGRWSELLELAADGVARCERYGYRRYRAILGGYHSALVAVARGDTGPGLAAATEMAATMTARGAGIGAHFAHQIRALAATGDGDHAEAFREATAISPAGTLAPYTPHALWVLLEVVEGALGAGRVPEARAHVEAMTTAGLAGISPRLAMVTAGCAAMVDDDAAAFERALAVPEGERWPFDLARVHLAYGRHLRRRRRPAAARAQLTSALEIFERLGARPWIRQAAGELRAEGRRGAAPDDDRILSPQERRVAELAAAGLSNKQIGERLGLSSRTVGNHLYRVFPKLGITSRAALRDALD